MDNQQNNGNNQDVHSTAVKAGRRIYYFDVKATRNDDLYLTITESKKSTHNGETKIQRHKIFLYKEDFEKFSDALSESLTKIEELKSSGVYPSDNDYQIED